ncbi:MAG: hypothetical protein HQL82_12565 [Magnetococcales bacterium]|nr:hypothetical protein [Magnetococcales bacterium]
MGELVIRNLDDEIIERLKARAVAHRQSLEQMLREILAGALLPSQEKLAAEIGGCSIRAERENRTAPGVVDRLVMTADRIAAMGPSRIEADVVAMIRLDRETR